MSFSRRKMYLRLQLKKLAGYTVRRNRNNPRIRHDLGVLFVHIPKTGGNSVTRAISSIPFRGKSLSPAVSKHAKAEEIRYLIGEEEYSRLFSFAVVRNPWDLMVSSFHWWLQKAPTISYHRKKAEEVAEMNGFDEFIRSPFGSEMINEREGNLFDWYSNGETTIVNHVAKLEEMGTQWPVILEKAGLPVIELPHINKSSRGDYSEYYSSASKKLVAKRFEKTIDLFHYTFSE